MRLICKRPVDYTSEKASALIVVIMLMFVLLVFSASIVTYARSGAFLTEKTKDRIQAYYIARSGAEAVAAWMEKYPYEGKQLIGSQLSTPVELGEGKISKIRVYYKDPSNPRQENGVIIESTGVVGGETRTVTLTMTEKYEPAVPPIDMAVFSMSSITLSGSATVKGLVGTNSFAPNSVVLTGSAKIEGNVYIGPSGDPTSVVSIPSWDNPSNFIVPNGWAGVTNLSEERMYPSVSFPEFPADLPQKPALNISGGPSNDEVIEGDGYYPSITIRSDRRLTIRLNGSETRIRTDSLNISQGHIVIEGEGKLILYVDSTFSMSGSSTINVDPEGNKYTKDGDQSKLITYYKGSAPVDSGGATRYVGTFCAETAEIKITGSGGIVGTLITMGDDVKISGDASADVRVLYAPFADVSMGGSGKLKGSIIAKSFAASGSASVIYSQIPDYEFPVPVEGGEILRYERGLWL